MSMIFYLFAGMDFSAIYWQWPNYDHKSIYFGMGFLTLGLIYDIWMSK